MQTCDQLLATHHSSVCTGSRATALDFFQGTASLKERKAHTSDSLILMPLWPILLLLSPAILSLLILFEMCDKQQLTWEQTVVYILLATGQGSLHLLSHSTKNTATNALLVYKLQFKLQLAECNFQSYLKFTLGISRKKIVSC